jgi:hypothetical protein
MVNVDAATRRGILVTNVPNDWCQNEVADHAMALLLAAARNICTHDRRGVAYRGGRPCGRTVPASRRTLRRLDRPDLYLGSTSADLLQRCAQRAGQCPPRLRSSPRSPARIMHSRGPNGPPGRDLGPLRVLALHGRLGANSPRMAEVNT